MADLDLVFQSAPATSNNLVFGELDVTNALMAVTGSFAPLTVSVNIVTVELAEITGSFQPLGVDVLMAPVVEAEVTGSFAPLDVEVEIWEVQTLTVTGSFAPMEFTMSATYGSYTNRPTVGLGSNGWQVATKTEPGVTLGQQGTVKTPTGWEAFWQRTTGGPQGIEHKLPSVLEKGYQDRVAGHQDASKLHTAAGFAHQDTDRTLRLMLNDAFEQASKVRNSTLFIHQDGDHTKRASRTNPWQNGKPVRKGYTTDFQKASLHRTGRRTPYQDGVPPPPGISLVPVPPVVPPYVPGTDLVFSYPFGYGGTHLVFTNDDYTVAPKEPVVVPVQRVYIVANNITLRRVSDNALVICTGIALSLDCDSWTWSFSASLPGSELSKVEPTTEPVELKATINGTEFRVLAENVARERVFGKSTIRVSGKGRNAALDAPYAAVQTFTNTELRSAQQLMGDVLTLNGIPLGWTVNWLLEDWNVPAGAFTHQGTYVSALGSIVKAAGGFLLPHPSAKSFTAKPLYPAAPWNWGTLTPDFVLPADVTTRESLEWVAKPEYNRVFVSGQGVGVVGQVTRTSTAGDIVAPMVVDALITDTIAARQRGLSVLADTGRQIRVGLRLPVLDSTGIIQPGSFVQYEDGATIRRGVVRSTSVDAKLPDVWQSLEVQSYA